MKNEEKIRRQDGEQGYTLIAVMFLLFLLALSLTIAAPRMAREIQLDRERETMHRALQYRHAIQLYYRKFRAYPPTIDALVKTSEIRFLRRRYLDPITGKDDWKLIHYGQNKTQTLGFFGQPLAGGSSTLAGVGATSGTGSLSGSSSLFGSSSTDSASSSTASSSAASSGSTTGTSTTSSFGTSTSLSSSSSSSSGSSTSGQTFGGLGIIGVSPNSAKQSIMIYKKKTHYNEWEFFYDPISDQKTVSGSLGSLSSSSSGSLTSASSSSSTSSSATGSSSTSSGSSSSSSPF